MPTKLIMYECSYCNKFRTKKKIYVEDHESRCFFNPKNKACLTCEFCKRRLRDNEEQHNYFGFVYTCSKYNISMFNRTNSKINIDNNTGEIIAEKSRFIRLESEKLIFPTSGCNEWRKKINKKKKT